MNKSERLKIALITGLRNDWISVLVTRFKDIQEVKFDNVIYWRKREQKLKKIKRNISKHGILYILWLLIRCINKMFLKKIHTSIDRILLFPKIESDLFSTCSELNINLHEINDIHSDEGIQLIKSFNCDLLVVCGTGILKESVFELPKLGSINLHQGEVPKYRGAPPGFWELWNKEKQVGVTVHFVDKGVDTGDIILQEIVPIFEYDNFRTTMRKLSEISLSLYPEAIRIIASGKYRRIKQPQGTGKQYYFPTLKQRAILFASILCRQLNVISVFKNILKKMLFLTILCIIQVRDFHLRMRGRNILSILYYHRVTDICQDGMTIGVQEFEKQIRFLKKHYHIILPSDLHKWLGQDGNLKGEKGLLITFDDGYEDNYINALPILKKYSCPAIIFIPTAFVGNEKQFEHDSELQPELQFRKMDWDQLKDAILYNIAIGIHSDTHCNLGNVSYHEGVREIETSIKKYVDNMGKRPVFMSYPFGGKQDITARLVDYVKNHQMIKALFSAFGNKNISPIDKYNIKRINIGSKDNDLLTFWYKTEGELRTLSNPYESWL